MQEWGREIMGPLEALTIFDWITPTMNLLRGAAGMRPISVYWSARNPAYYERLLKRRGIKAKPGGIVAGKGFILMVPKGSMDRARAILGKAGANLA
jgi:hypothetical protein